MSLVEAATAEWAKIVGARAPVEEPQPDSSFIADSAEPVNERSFPAEEPAQDYRLQALLMETRNLSG
jgi:hypothetical protein